MNYKQIAQEVIQVEVDSLLNLKSLIGEEFQQVIEALLACEGKVIMSGMGKSGIVAKKIAATLASTGTPSFFIHPGEAYHGDLGMIEAKDAVILISNSGETNEVLKLIAFLKDNGNTIVGISNKGESTLAKNSTYHIDLNVLEEACPLDLAPTSSTTSTLVVGDAIAVALMKARAFKAENFARFHPGGSLGKKLLTKVSDTMRNDNLPYLPLTATADELVIKMSEGRLGMVIIGSENSVEGIVTDGDLRRALVKYKSFSDLTIENILNTSPIFVSEDQKLSEVEEMMLGKKITSVLVGSANELKGVYQIYF
ncbi:KpsF/GutQ family sugar-phosphate isomerase [Cyclobacteriaceae bacterium]|nr:KpsF/GutQ family sugar-phosphate isomerase [Cyclobacteriaceae bacterium]